MENVVISVDAMGGDHAPAAMVDGCIQAINQDARIKVILLGDVALIEAELLKYTYKSEQVEIVEAKEKIEMDESPVLAIRRKKDSSIVKGLRLVQEKKAHAFVSAGSTGAILAGGTLIVGRIKGIERPALGSFLPSEKGFTLLMDCGANVDSKPEYLHQFAKMGAIYYESFMGVNNPRVALVNIGEEETKGNQLTKETFGLLKNDAALNFVGNIEAREIPKGAADVAICDGFVGNVILKLAEGLASTIFGMLKQTFMSSLKTKISAVFLKPELKKMMKRFDYSEYGGAPLLGLEGLVVKAHGSSDAKAFKNAILQCKKFNEEKVNEKIKQNI